MLFQYFCLTLILYIVFRTLISNGIPEKFLKLFLILLLKLRLTRVLLISFDIDY
nr:MAG TPA: hypothetical protein [Caudoviricetes sp.]